MLALIHHFSLSRSAFRLSLQLTALLFDPFCRPIYSALMKDQSGCSALILPFESNLSVNYFIEILSIVFRIYLKLLLPGSLYEEVSAIARDCQNETRCELVTPRVGIEQFGVDGHLFVFFG